MYEAARKLTRKDSSGALERAGFAFDARFMSRFSGHFYAYGAQFVDKLEDPTKCVMNEPKQIELLELLARMQAVERITPPAEWYQFGSASQIGLPGGNREVFRQGKLAMGVTLHELAQYRQEAAALQWDYAPLPRENGSGKAGTFAGSALYLGVKTTKEPDAIWKLVSSVGSKQHAEWMMRDPGVNRVPPYRSLQAQYGQLTPPDNVFVNLEIGEYGTPSFKSSVYIQVQDEILGGLGPVWRGQVAVRQGAEEITRKVNEILKGA
jgi:ABC-type glycerol-3-phosphate transport system substrate-binding protein